MGAESSAELTTRSPDTGSEGWGLTAPGGRESSRAGVSGGRARAAGCRSALRRDKNGQVGSRSSSLPAASAQGGHRNHHNDPTLYSVLEQGEGSWMHDLDFEKFVPMLKDLRELFLKYDKLFNADVLSRLVDMAHLGSSDFDKELLQLLVCLGDEMEAQGIATERIRTITEGFRRTIQKEDTKDVPPGTSSAKA